MSSKYHDISPSHGHHFSSFCVPSHWGSRIVIIMLMFANILLHREHSRQVPQRRRKRLQLRWTLIAAVATGVAAQAAAPCNHSSVTTSYTVKNSDDVISLADAVSCSGGSFFVDWSSKIATTETIRIFEGTVLSISGTRDGSSAIGRSGQASLFQAINGTLHLSHITVTSASRGNSSAIVALDSHITATNCVFSDNVGNLGGGIYLSESTLDIAHSTLANNSAAVAGGVICAVNSTISLSGDTYFTNNSSPGEGSGGAILAQNSTVRVSGSAKFVGNVANHGGALFTAWSDLIVDGEICFAQNAANINAGGVYGILSTINVSGSAVWEGNSATFGGGAFLYYGCKFVVSGSVTFDHNYAAQAGGLWLSEQSLLDVSGSATITSHAVKQEGGGIIVFDSTANFSGLATCINNSAWVGGCIIAWGYGSVNVDGYTNFSFNAAGRGASVALLEGTSGNFRGGHVTMTGNTALSSGGALYVEATSSARGLMLEQVNFSSNYAGDDGGAITMLSVGTLLNRAKILTCNFQNNKAGDTGGGVFFAGGFAHMSGSIFSENVAGKLRHAPNADGRVDWNQYA